MRTHIDVDGLEILSAPRRHGLNGPGHADPWTAQSPFVIGEMASDSGRPAGNVTLRLDPSAGPWHLEQTGATGEASEADRGDARSAEAFEREAKASCQCDAARPLRRHRRDSERQGLTSDEIIAVLACRRIASRLIIILDYMPSARGLPQQVT